MPRMTATGIASALPITSSAADASSSTNATSVTCSSRPKETWVPRRSMIGDKPKLPIATSVTPLLQGRPKVSLIMTATSTPCLWKRESWIFLADLSGNFGRRAA